MILGPFTLNDVKRLQELLETEGAKAEVILDPSTAEKARQESKRRSSHPRRLYQGIDAHIYLDIPEEHIPLVEQDLMNMGVSLQQAEPLLGEEFLCPECDYHSLQQGLCPKHHKPLVDFSSWNAKHKKISDRRWAYLCLFVLAAVISFLFVHHFIGQNW